MSKVERLDIHIFFITKIPAVEDGEQRIADWLEAVKKSEKRKELKISKENKILAQTMRESMR